MITIAFILPLIVLLGIVLYFFVKKEDLKNPKSKSRKNLLFFGFGCGILSIISLLAAFYISHDYTHLYKIALPLMLMINIYAQLNATKL